MKWLEVIGISYHCFAEKLVNHIDTVSEKEPYYEALVYGMEIAISTICNMLLVLGIGICFNIFIETVVFAIFFMPYRMTTGGRHAKSHHRCILLYIICEISSIFVARQCMDTSILKIFFVVCVLASVCICFIYGDKKLQNDIMEKRFKRLSHIILSLDGIVLILMLLNGGTLMKYGCLGTLAIVIQSCSLLPVWNLKGR